MLHLVALAATALLLPHATVERSHMRVAHRATGCRACADAPGDTEEPASTAAPNLESELMRVAASTNRGATRSDDDARSVDDLIAKLESSGSPDVSSGALDGSWSLAYATCPAYRSSPFFSGFGQLAGQLASPLYAITDRMPFYKVGAARQTLTGTSSTDGMGTLVSAIEVDLVAFDASLRSVMTTSASVRPDSEDASTLILELQTTEVKDSALPLSGMLTFPTARVFDGLKSGSASVRLRTSYLSDTMRITRAPDGAVLVYVPE